MSPSFALICRHAFYARPRRQDAELRNRLFRRLHPRTAIGGILSTAWWRRAIIRCSDARLGRRNVDGFVLVQRSPPSLLRSAFPVAIITAGTAHAAAISGSLLDAGRQAGSRQLGQPVIIENRSGNSTDIAVQAVVNSPPDGYTLLWHGLSSVVNTSLFTNLPFDIQRHRSVSRRRQLSNDHGRALLGAGEVGGRADCARQAQSRQDAMASFGTGQPRPNHRIVRPTAAVADRCAMAPSAEHATVR